MKVMLIRKGVLYQPDQNSDYASGPTNPLTPLLYAIGIKMESVFCAGHKTRID
ncbi:hypothetical protein PAUR_a1040 [Pseudoalteromonas aurantia 208]|uniref:Uncharacterized protein n=1 Tax=Pseudoalteromonas aurantia 208 TaxID=1314867 RepID=A0ABR9EBL6_9GAMM|nr:hypothetical protein [Pseudoalteromonas aurantia 208]